MIQIKKYVFAIVAIIIMTFLFYSKFGVGDSRMSNEDFKSALEFLPKKEEVKIFVVRPFSDKSTYSLIDKSALLKIMPGLQPVPRGAMENRIDWKYKNHYAQEGIIVLSNGKVLWWMARFSDDASTNSKPLSYIEFIETKPDETTDRYTYLIHW